MFFNPNTLPYIVTRLLLAPVQHEVEQMLIEFIEHKKKELAEKILADILQQQQQQLANLLTDFLGSGMEGVNPVTAFDFEIHLEELLREFGRQIVESVYNQIEPSEQEGNALQKHILWELTSYRRLNKKTRNGEVATLFGKITLFRFLYRDDQTGEPSIFPLEMRLGLVEGATPALADQVARFNAENGATQHRILEKLKRHHGVNWGRKKLRKFLRVRGEQMEEFRQPMQVQRVLKLLEQAQNSRGRCRPSLSVGRDGVTLCSQPHSFYEVASAATITVYDRRGKRLGTVYLGYPPESGQHTMSQNLTGLIQDILRGWDGPMPRLCYVTDAGDNETTYYDKVLSKMVHPKTGKPLVWQRVVDYYHAAVRITTMAQKLFGKGSDQARSWGRRMRKLMLQENGARRVLQSAAIWRRRCKLSDSAQEEYQLAYNYIHRRLVYMNYWEYRRVNLAIGSGVTEAACKTLFTERLKLSGMRWKKAGAQTVLQYRVIYRSDVWAEVRTAMLEHQSCKLPCEVTIEYKTQAANRMNSELLAIIGESDCQTASENLAV